MPLWVTIQPWVFITMCWSRQYGFNLVCYPRLMKNQKIENWKSKIEKSPGFELGTFCSTARVFDALDRSTIFPGMWRKKTKKHEKHPKRWFQPAYCMQSTNLLVEIHNSLDKIISCLCCSQLFNWLKGKLVSHAKT